MVDRNMGSSDYSLRLAAYDPTNMDYPAAVSNVVHVYVELAKKNTIPRLVEPSDPFTHCYTLTEKDMLAHAYRYAEPGPQRKK